MQPHPTADFAVRQDQAAASTNPSASGVELARWRIAASACFGDCCAYTLANTTSEPLLFKGDDFAQTGIVAAT